MSGSIKNVLRYALVLVLGFGLLVPASSASAAPKPVGADPLSKHDRELIAEARTKGRKTVTLLIASRAGSTAGVAQRVRALGGSVGYRDDELGYLRVHAPAGKAAAIAGLPGVQAADVDEIIPLPDPSPEGVADPTPQPPPGPGTPLENPYMPTQDTNAADFVEEYPRYDGRRTTVGIIDSGVDLDHPALRTTPTGERKIVDWVTYTHPVRDNDPTWIRMTDTVTGATFAYRGVTYTAPVAGTYRIGLFNERDPRLGGEVGNDVNRDGNPAGSSGIFAVLWDRAANTVYVDANQNQSFADEQAMTDYKVRNDVGTFGADNPATPLREAMPFVVQTFSSDRAVANYINIGIVSGAHGSHVGGIVAANGMFGGAMSGAAPGAKLVSVRVCLFNPAGCTTHALWEGMIYAARTANVDVINMSLGLLPALNYAGPGNARALLYDRLIEEEQVQMFISAGNSGPGVNTIGDPSLATRVMSVGSYISRATWRANYGSDSEHKDSLHGFTSRGPSEDGAFKPQIVAPGSAVSTTPRWQAGGPVPGTYALPPGYSMFNGTSMASPQAAGAAALLVSAAKQRGLGYSPAHIRKAMNSSAEFLNPKRFQAFDQGNGLLKVDDAWELIQRDVARPDEFISSVPVRSALSPLLLPTPGIGRGIYDREGVKAGDSYTRTYTLTRRTGAAEPVTYRLRWKGNDGTFSTAATVTLALDTPVQLPVAINPKTSGAHSAILNLDDPTVRGIEFQTMNVVIAAEQFVAAGNYTVTKRGVADRNQVLRYFFNLPAGTPAFKVDLPGPSAAAGTGQVRFLRFHPYGVGIDSNASTQCFLPPTPAGCDTGSPSSRTLANPFPGVWEVTVDARRTSDVEEAPFTLTASILGAAATPNPLVIESAKVGAATTASLQIRNLYGDFIGGAVGSPLGSAATARPTIADGAVQQYTVAVDAGSTSLTARIGNPSDKEADLDLYVLKGSVVVGRSEDGDSEEEVAIANPSGTYTIQVNGFDVPAGTTAYDYLDVFVNPRYGTVAVTDPPALHPAGSSWTVPVVVTPLAVPLAGRILLGAISVQTDAGVTVGTGEVRVLNVTP